MNDLVNEKDIDALKDKARILRIEILKMLTTAGSGHTGGSLSAADIVAALYFYKMRHNPGTRSGSKGTGSSFQRGMQRLFFMQPSPSQDTLIKPCLRLCANSEVHCRVIPARNCSPGSRYQQALWVKAFPSQTASPWD